MAKRKKTKTRYAGTTAKRKRRKRLILNLEKLCRDIICLRDDSRCQHCDKYVEKQNAHCSHVIPKSRGNALRFDLLNLLLFCFHCHIQWWHQNPLEADKWFQEKYPVRYEYLMGIESTVKKYSLEELEDLYVKLSQKRNELTRENSK